MQKVKRHAKRVIIGITGGIVLLVGIIAIPYPGPGWLIVFSGLAILATEFTWAQRLLDYAKGKYDAWIEWLKRQHISIRILVLSLTCAVVLLTLWLLNVFGMVAGWLDISTEWLRSPFAR